MAINNPLIPGDPYSYDLKWLVSQVKTVLAHLDALDTEIEQKIFDGFTKHSIIQFKTVPEMQAAEIKDGMIVYTLGYHEAGDLGALFYLIKDFNPSQCSLDYFLIMDNNSQIAIPLFTTPYVTPEMFGAYGDGVADDTAALKTAFSFENVELTKNYILSGTVDLMDRQRVNAGKSQLIVRTRGENVFYGNGISDFQWTGGTLTGDGVTATPHANLFSFDNSNKITIDGAVIEDLPYFWAVRLNTCNNCAIYNCKVDHYSYGAFAALNGCDTVQFDGNTIFDLDAMGTGNGYPIMMSGGETENFAISKNITATRNYIDNRNVIRWEGIDAHGGENLIVSNNVVKNCLFGISLFNERTPYIYELRNVIINDNICIGSAQATSTGYGIVIGAYGATVTGNVIRGYNGNYSDAGIYIRYASDVHIIGNTIYDCSMATLLSYNAEANETGAVKISNNLICECGRYTEQPDAVVFRIIDRQKHTEIVDNTLVNSNGVFRTTDTVNAASYIKFIDNNVANSVSEFFNGVNGIVTDWRTIAPSAANTKMGKLGDICKLRQPAAGSPIGWICSSPWDGTSVTWLPLPTI